MRFKVLWLVGLMLAATAGQVQAGVIFSFSITNVFGYGNVPGTVTGKIYGLNDNSTGAASQVTIESFPIELSSIYSAPIDATLWTIVENSFTVSAGQIVSGGFWAHDTPPSSSAVSSLYLNSGESGVNYFGDGVCFVYGDFGITGTNFTPVSSAVPEPSSIVMLSLGALGMMFARRKRQQKKLAS